MSASESNEFLTWYEGQNVEVFDNRRVLKLNCVLRETCRVLRQEFKQIGNIDVFIESCTIASACRKVMRKNFLRPNTITIISSGGYTGNVNYSNKAIM